MAKVLIVRLGAMGDVLHAIPAAAALRQADASLEIGWAIEDRWKDLLTAQAGVAGPLSQSQPLVDRVHVVDTRAWRKHLLSASTWGEIQRVREELTQERYDLALDLQGSWKSALLAKGSGARRVAGSITPREAGVQRLYSARVRAHGAHVIEQGMEIALGGLYSLNERAHTESGRMDLAQLAGSLPTDAKAERWAESSAGQLESRRFAVLNPGAGWKAKEWPAQEYGRLAQHLRQRAIASLVNHGPGEEALAAEVVHAAEGAAQPVSCSIAQLISLIRRAAVCIGGDTGPVHLAALLAIPTVALFGPTDPKRNGPFYPLSRTLRHAQSENDYSHSRIEDAGLRQISVEQVMAAAEDVMAQQKSPVRE